LISPYEFTGGLGCFFVVSVFRFLGALLLLFLRCSSFILFLLSLRRSLCGIIVTASFLWLFSIALNRFLNYVGGNWAKIVVAEIGGQRFFTCCLS